MLTLILTQTNSGLFFYNTDGSISEQSIAYIKKQMPGHCFADIKQISDVRELHKMKKISKYAESPISVSHTCSKTYSCTSKNVSHYHRRYRLDGGR